MSPRIATGDKRMSDHTPLLAIQPNSTADIVANAATNPTVSLPTLPFPIRLSSTPPSLTAPTLSVQFHILLSLFFFFSGVAISSAVRSKLILDANGNDLSQASIFNGVVLSLQALLSCVISPLCGVLSDRVGRKPLLLLAHTGEFFALLLFSQYPDNLPVIFFAVLLLSTTVVYSSLVAAIISDTANHGSDSESGSERRGNVAARFGYVGAVLGICLIYGPILGGLLEGHVYPLSSLHLSCVFIIIAFFYVCFLLPETLPTVQSAHEPHNTQTHASFFSKLSTLFSSFTRTTFSSLNPFPRAQAILFESLLLRDIAFAYAILSFTISGATAIFYFYVHDRLGWGVENFAIFLTFLGLSSLITQAVLVRPLITILGERRATMFGMAMLIASGLCYAFATTSTHMYIGLMLSAPGFVVDPAIKSLLARSVPPCNQGTLQGSLSALSNITKSISPLLSNALFGIGVLIGWTGLPMLLFVIVKTAAVAFLWRAFTQPDDHFTEHGQAQNGMAAYENIREVKVEGDGQREKRVKVEGLV